MRSVFTMVFGLLKRCHVSLSHASGNDDCHFTGLLRGLNEIMHVKCLAHRVFSTLGV